MNKSVCKKLCKRHIKYNLTIDTSYKIKNKKYDVLTPLCTFTPKIYRFSYIFNDFILCKQISNIHIFTTKQKYRLHLQENNAIIINKTPVTKKMYKPLDFFFNVNINKNNNKNNNKCILS